MLKQLLQWIAPRTYNSDLERYISSKHPQSVFDVEKLEREYNTKLSQGKLI